MMPIESRHCIFLMYMCLALLAPALHAETVDSLITTEEFSAFAAEMAPKVNLFREVWRRDPKAEFFGGTSRDFLYWLKGKIQGAKTREEALGRMDAVRKLPAIDIRSFITSESDADVVSSQDELKQLAQRFGIKKVDLASPDRFDATTEMGRTEVKQGFLPVEKIRLGRKGIVETPVFGSGLEEIFTGRLTAHFADPKVFAETFYAKQGQNHQVLLALRYIRLLAMDYFYTYGRGYPKHLDSMKIDAASETAAKEVLRKAISGKGLAKLLEDVSLTSRRCARSSKSNSPSSRPSPGTAPDASPISFSAWSRNACASCARSGVRLSSARRARSRSPSYT